ncbi:putative alpha-ketoglutarate-dependent 2,4-dichlorophenoxyacetate dioxygenase [Chaetomium fimeti]|uniref:Alpha-ketoglutarate-dependent 2,4-dichlorophenoxyacetate dioxygenase n=1 Tax=Chaetomium fimeti TaxID=1854472 RepID=A0AAE0LMR1_9PEZI|nr:putative alpha-ketoglutarate-dependent 2,4-dichlorophenoxyacetate dioxygenase [Chaetomium fimeti]
MAGSGITFKPLAPTFGAEAIGVDFSQPVPKSTIDLIRNGMALYGMLVFRATQLDDAGHVAFASQFGDLDDQTPWLAPGQPYRLGQWTQLSDVGNIEADGQVVQKDSIRYQINQGNRLFHVDCSYNPRRAGFSILRAHTLPPSGTGGGTAFADSRTAYNDLEAQTKEKIKDLVLWHSLWHSRRLGAPDSEILQGIDPEAHAMARHKLVQLHEPSGRMTLYVARHAFRVDGWTREESEPVIGELLSHASQDKYTVQVEWENDGDLIMWDNTCVMHRATGGEYQGKYVRDMRRATVLDSSSTAWGLNDPSGERSGMFASTTKNTSWVKTEGGGETEVHA